MACTREVARPLVARSTLLLLWHHRPERNGVTPAGTKTNLDTDRCADSQRSRLGEQLKRPLSQGGQPLRWQDQTRQIDDGGRCIRAGCRAAQN